MFTVGNCHVDMIQAEGSPLWLQYGCVSRSPVELDRFAEAFLMLRTKQPKQNRHIIISLKLAYHGISSYFF